MKEIKIFRDKDGKFHFQSGFESHETIGLLETMREMVMLEQAQEWKKINQKLIQGQPNNTV
jgi:hypothetical protein